ncbi:hypothetical protein K6W26_22925 [Burkholderia sp. AU42008]|uniref:hypothetical protein n=1 Tax=Burkholderia TaxID=32008 RepID=UPI000B79C9D8|nr:MULTISPECIES: hypothetical protein [Burkholderia]MBR8234647.1 hypothetical protein [Burkholderia sp. AU32357]MBY4875910.1 hypothetical protein [Burkholderia sp. AU42008]MDN7814868.1 hypothetical protein [Burkholderia vietnamiensis]OXI44902.1 hypothetical protein CFB49_07540 [Burkholderia sp. AU17457]
MEIADIARRAGLAVTLDARIGREEYQSATGSLEALRRFALAYIVAPSNTAELVERLRNRAALQIDARDSEIMLEAARVLSQNRLGMTGAAAGPDGAEPVAADNQG